MATPGKVSPRASALNVATPALAPAALVAPTLSTAPPSTVRSAALALVPVGLWRLDDAGKNYFTNSDFEFGMTGWLEWWGANSSIDSTVSFTGTKSLKLVGHPTSGVGRYQVITLDTGTYVVSAMARASADYISPGNPFPYIENGTGTSVDAGGVGLPNITAGMDWTRVGRKFTVTVAGTFHVILCHSYNGGPSTGTVWYDLGQLEAGPLATAWDAQSWSPSVKDISGSGFDGAITGSVVKTVGGAAAGDPASAGMSFDGSLASTRIEVPDSPALRFTTAFTLLLWVKYGAASGYLSILGKYAGNQTGWDLGREASGRLRMTIRGTSNIDSVGAGPIVSDNLWHRAAIVCTPTQILMYDAGLIAATINGTWTPVTNTVPLRIGARDVGVGAFGGFVGSLKDVEIVGRGLSPVEINNDWLSSKFPLPAALASSIAPAATVAASVAVLT